MLVADFRGQIAEVEDRYQLSATRECFYHGRHRVAGKVVHRVEKKKSLCEVNAWVLRFAQDDKGIFASLSAAQDDTGWEAEVETDRAVADSTATIFCSTSLE